MPSTAPINPHAPQPVLFVLWPKSRPRQEAILERLMEDFQLLEIYDLEWSSGLIGTNLSRLYLTPKRKLPFRRGGPRVVMLWDQNPCIDCGETATAREFVNAKVSRAKVDCRRIGGGNGSVHAANTLGETDFNLRMFLGVSLEAYCERVRRGELATGVVRLKRDLTGSGGWNSFAELFATVGSQCSYLVLRGAEELVDGVGIEEGTDIDFLTDCPADLAVLLGVRRGRIRVAGREVAVDIRAPGDWYLPPRWARELLRNRVRNGAGIYVPDGEDGRYSLLYHIAVHKRILPRKYLPLLPGKGSEALRDLLGFMARRGYDFGKPLDRKCFYDSRWESLWRHLDFMVARWRIRSIEPVDLVLWKRRGDGIGWLRGVDSEGRMLSIKAFGEQDMLYRECRLAKRLADADSEHFLKPVFYKLDKDKRYLAYALPEGEWLSEALAGGSLDATQKVAAVRQLARIAALLAKEQIVARTIEPESFWLARDGRLLLLDLTLAAAPRLRLKEFDGRLRDLPFLAPNAAYPRRGVWNDAGAFRRLAASLGDSNLSLPEMPTFDSRRLFRLREIRAHLLRPLLHTFRR